MQYTYVYLAILIIALSFLPLTKQLFGIKEGYDNLSIKLESGKFPNSMENPILECDYPVKDKPQLSGLSSSNIWQEYPVFPVGNYEQKTNNIRYWKNPNNGKCSPANFCNSIYNDKELSIPAAPAQPAWDSGIRVNFYDSIE
jgi:hypothetical protein